MRRISFLLILLLAGLLPACQMAGGSNPPNSSSGRLNSSQRQAPGKQSGQIEAPETPAAHPAQAVLKATATPPRFESIAEAPPVETAAPAVGLLLTGTLPLTPTMQPAPLIELPAGVQVGVLLGTDQFAPYRGRTDTILLVFYQPDHGSVSLLSVPRDLYVYIPEHGMDRINTAYAYGGVDLLYQTLEYNLGIRPQHYALAHLDDFIKIVNDVGGVDVWVSNGLEHDCGGIPDGLVHMNGLQALCYVRERQTTNDFDRARRQQEVLQAIFQRMLRMEVLFHIPEWFERYSQNVRTDAGVSDILALIPLALRLQDGKQIHHFQITPKDVTDRMTPDGKARVLYPIPGRISAVLESALEVLKTPVPTPENLPTRLALFTPTPWPAFPEPTASQQP